LSHFLVLAFGHLACDAMPHLTNSFWKPRKRSCLTVSFCLLEKRDCLRRLPKVPDPYPYPPYPTSIATAVTQKYPSCQRVKCPGIFDVHFLKGVKRILEFREHLEHLCTCQKRCLYGPSSSRRPQKSATRHPLHPFCIDSSDFFSGCHSKKS
jgi:hypothetical protein